jgi:general secretion pathway protein K
LLTVLWISAALAALGFALANTVRGEIDRTSTTVDELRAYYLAAGAIDKAALEVMWSALAQGERKLPKNTTQVDYPFLTGMAHVEIVPEAAKLDVNTITPERLARLLEGLGAPADHIPAVVEGIVARRTGQGSSFSSLQGPTFPGAGASLQEIEELLTVRGVTPDIFYGGYGRPAGLSGSGQPGLVRHSGLIDCLSVFGSKVQVDVNAADPAVLHALGMPDSGIAAVLEARRSGPMDEKKYHGLVALFGPAAPFLRQEGNSIITFRSTGRVLTANGQLSDLKRTVSAVVKYMPKGYDSPIHILRWYDTSWSN